MKNKILPLTLEKHTLPWTEANTSLLGTPSSGEQQVNEMSIIADN